MIAGGPSGLSFSPCLVVVAFYLLGCISSRVSYPGHRTFLGVLTLVFLLLTRCPHADICCMHSGAVQLFRPLRAHITRLGLPARPPLSRTSSRSSFLFSTSISNRRHASSSKMEAQGRSKVGRDWQAPAKEGKLLTGLKVNNSMTGGKTEFIPQEGNRINWYGCGPTVYDAAHMGHARTYVAFDVIRRILSDYFGYDVNMVMNITDIDDKIIARSQEQGVNFLELARHWEKEFFKDMQALNVLLPSVVTRVSEYVPEVLKLIEEIIDNGFAYESQGSVYFDTQRFGSDKLHTYGRMEPGSVADQSRREIVIVIMLALVVLSRVLEGEGALGLVSSEKRHPCDFALWKKAKPDEPSWESKWGAGRPGWHIECSAMASTILPFPLDVHSGGIDLRFPHHDNELAQSEAAKNKPQWFVVDVAHLTPCCEELAPAYESAF
ncbi:hypothetical protein ACSSS7_002773 [Eimeria intestinalis]